jgi:FkbM family methyltransferase
MKCQLRRASLHNIKQILRNVAPRPVAYVSYLRALFENEIELRLLPLLCDPKRTSIDVGAFTGIYTVGAAIHSRDVIAVEPQHRQAETLLRSMPGNVRVVEAALSRVSGSGLLKMPSVEGSSMSRLDASPALTAGWLEVPVPLMRMDDLDRGQVGFVKIDAEGHEIEVLEGAVKIIGFDKPNFIIEAEERYCKGAIANLVRFLTKFGYEGWFVYRSKLRPVREFDPAKHQDPNLILGGNRSGYSDYVNNFVFVNSARAVSLPRKVPAGCRATYESISRLRI